MKPVSKQKKQQTESCFYENKIDHTFPPMQLSLYSSFIKVDIPEVAYDYFKYHTSNPGLLKCMTGFYWTLPVFKINIGEYRRHAELLRVFPVSVTMNDQQTLFKFRIAARREEDLALARTWIEKAEIVNDINDDGVTRHWEFTFGFKIAKRPSTRI